MSSVIANGICLENDDGITVIDISKPETPSYCFLTQQTPLNARGYLKKYYAKDVESLSRQVIGPARIYGDDTSHEEEEESDDEEPCNDEGGLFCRYVSSISDSR